MSGLFYNLGRMVGPKVRKGKWLWQSLTGSRSEAVAAEYEVGKDLAAEIRSQMEFAPAGEAAQLTGDICDRLSKCVADKHRRFSISVLRAGKPNAFALPGGFLFVTESMVQLCEANSDELAFVIAHEMAHVIRGHAIERIMGDSAMAAASKAAIARGPIGAWVKRVGIRFLQSAYSQDREFEADGLGARLAVAAGYDSTGGQKLLERLGRLEESKGASLLGEYFSSHPPIANRIAGINRMLKKSQG